jgi:hypothetical protein
LKYNFYLIYKLSNERVIRLTMEFLKFIRIIVSGPSSAAAVSINSCEGDEKEDNTILYNKDGVAMMKGKVVGFGIECSNTSILTTAPLSTMGLKTNH